MLPLHHSPPKYLKLLRFLEKSCKVLKESCKPPLQRGRYSCVRVHGLVFFPNDLQAPAAVVRDLHLILESHVDADVLAGHADVVRNLVDLLALLSPGKDAWYRAARVCSDGRFRPVRCPIRIS